MAGDQHSIFLAPVKFNAPSSLAISVCALAWLATPLSAFVEIVDILCYTHVCGGCFHLSVACILNFVLNVFCHAVCNLWEAMVISLFLFMLSTFYISLLKIFS